MNLPLMHSSEEVTLVAHSARCPLLPYFWALVRLLGWREAAQLSLLRLLADLWGAGGLLLLVSNHRSLIFPHFLSFSFQVILSACVPGACPRAVAVGRPGDGRQHALRGTNSVLCSVELLLVVLVAHSFRDSDCTTGFLQYISGNHTHECEGQVESPVEGRGGLARGVVRGLLGGIMGLHCCPQ